MGKIKSNPVDRFNERHEIGVRVMYWTGAKEGRGRVSKTMERAFLLGGHTPCVWVENQRSCIALTHIKVLRKDRDLDGI